MKMLENGHYLATTRHAAIIAFSNGDGVEPSNVDIPINVFNRMFMFC